MQTECGWRTINSAGCAANLIETPPQFAERGVVGSTSALRSPACHRSGRLLPVATYLGMHACSKPRAQAFQSDSSAMITPTRCRKANARHAATSTPTNPAFQSAAGGAVLGAVVELAFAFAVSPPPPRWRCRRRGGRARCAACGGCVIGIPGTCTTRRSSVSSCRAVSLPPHTAPVSMACTPWVMVSPSADQCPQTIFRSRSTRPGTSNHGYRPCACVPGVPLSSVAMRPRGCSSACA